MVQVALDYDPPEKVEVDNVTVHHIEVSTILHFAQACLFHTTGGS
jgi:hypothetical protein